MGKGNLQTEVLTLIQNIMENRLRHARGPVHLHRVHYTHSRLLRSLTAKGSCPSLVTVGPTKLGDVMYNCHSFVSKDLPLVSNKKMDLCLYIPLFNFSNTFIFLLRHIYMSQIPI